MKNVEKVQDATEEAPPLDRIVSRRWFVERMAWVSSAAAAGTLMKPQPAVASPRGATVFPEAFTEDASLAAVTDLTELSMSEAMTLIRNGSLAPADLVNAYFDRIEKYDPDYYQAFAARPRREDVLAEIARAPTGAPLLGMPIAPKDNFYTRDLLTEGGSLVYKDFAPEYDATAVALLRSQGGVVIGKAQMGALAGGRATVLGTTIPTTRNAWTPNDVDYSPAGSSSGSGTSVAGRLAVAALGTQTGGSVMGPGTAQGLTCIKPTFGRISLHGVIPLSYTRDHVGVMARNALDAAILLQVLAQPDPLDPRTLGLPPAPNYARAATPVGGARPGPRWRTRVGVWPEYLSGSDPEVNELRRAILRTMESLGMEIVMDIRLPDQWEEMTANPFGDSHGDPTAFFIDALRKDVRDFGARLPRFLNGMFQSADTYVKVQQVRQLQFERTMSQLFPQCDVVLTGAGGGAFDSMGLPMLCMPIGFVTEPRTGQTVPRGVTMAGPAFGEERLLAVAAAYQAVTDFHKVRPADPVV